MGPPPVTAWQRCLFLPPSSLAARAPAGTSRHYSQPGGGQRWRGGIRLLPAWPAPVANPLPCNWSWPGRGLQNDRWNFCNQAPPTPNPLDMPFPSQNKERLPPPKCQPDLMGDVPVLCGGRAWEMGKGMSLLLFAQ